MNKFFKLITIFIFISSCGYQPLYTSKNNLDFSIGKIETKGDKKLNKDLKNELKFYSSKDSKNIYDLIIMTELKKNISSKDTEGNPKSYNAQIINKVEFYMGENLKFKKSFYKSANYSNIESKFDLKIYEKNLFKNMIKQNAEDITLFIQSTSK